MAVNEGIFVQAAELFYSSLFVFSSTSPSRSNLGQRSAVLINFPNVRTLPAGQ